MENMEKSKVDRLLTVTRPIDSLFELSEKARKGLSEKQLSAKLEKLRAQFESFRIAFEFFHQLEMHNELVSSLLVDLYEEDEVDREAFMADVENLDGNIELLSKGMFHVRGLGPVTLFYEDRKTGEKKDLLPRFYRVGYKAPESVEYWPKNPSRVATRLSTSVAELKHVIGKILPGQTRFDVCYSSSDRRMRRLLIQGQSFAVSTEKASTDLDGESHTLRPNTLILATEPFSVDDVKKKKGATTIFTRGKGERNISVQDDGDGPYVVVHERQRPVIVLLEQDLLKKALLMFSYLEKKEREDILKRHVLTQKEIRSPRRGKDWSDVERAKAGGTPEAEDTADEEDQQTEDAPETDEDEVSTDGADAPEAEDENEETVESETASEQVPPASA